jgi:glyoxylase-like metal-dependent hydrolase (beta-lactamase superfamily II)
MQVKFKPCGDYQTNCYIYDGFIIDPGVNATPWVLKNIKNPKAILLTHGHFDHIWSVKDLKEELNIPVYIHKNDAFMLEEDIFNMNIPKTKADFLVDEGDINIDDTIIKFRHFPGHTPGCCTIEIDDIMFSGDFIFDGSIGRFDFPYSDQNDMKNSLKKFLSLNYDKIIYPGHGNTTTIKKAQESIKNYWLKVL